MDNAANFTLDRCRIVCDEYRLESIDAVTNISLQPKFVEVVEYLASNYPRLVSRTELINTVWNGNFLIGEQALTNAIWNLRQAFRKCLSETQVIDTVHKAGYRLLIEPKFEKSHHLRRPLKPLNLLTNKWLLSGLAFSLVVISAIIYSLQPKLQFQSASLQSITTEPGREVFPSLSPDDRWVVFKWIRQGHTDDLYLKNLERPDIPLKRLTFSEQEEGAPVWSKDAQTIFYNQVNRSNKQCHVVRLVLKSGIEEKIAPCQYQMLTQISLSPDGQYLAYVSPEENNLPATISILELSDLNKAPRKINCELNCDYRNRDLAFSPDNKTLAVTRRIGGYNENIFLIDLATEQTTQLTKGFKNIVGIAWHPNSQKMVFGSQESAFRNAYIVDVKSKEIQSLDVMGFGFPSFSNNGDFLIFHSRTAKRYIAALSLNKQANSVLFPLARSEFSHRNQSYSAINNKIVYTSNESGHFELWVSDTTGEQREQITYLEQELESPNWSHDGTKIVFLAPNGEASGNKIYLLDLMTKNVAMIESDYEAHGRPTWTADDTGIISSLYNGEKENLYIFPTNGETPTALTTDGGIYGQVDSSGNIYFTKEDKSLWVKSPESSAPPISILNDKGFSSLYSWTLTQSGIYYSQKEQDYFRVNYFDYQSEQVLEVTKLPWLTDDKYVSFSVIENEKKLLISVQEFPQANIKLLRHPLLVAK
ncbi:MAG: winged helix-turn-helix domain-containing protein [Kangiellaceae bacterium]|nr:winged helix-turn-helix domain-containing protein [Kangiellaceae bacterium]